MLDKYTYFYDRPQTAGYMCFKPLTPSGIHIWHSQSTCLRFEMNNMQWWFNDLSECEYLWRSYLKQVQEF